jgi:cobalt-precorrin 5A hydrolase
MERDDMKVAGFGFRTGASLASLQDALARAGGAQGVTHIATAADKAEADIFQTLAKTLNLPGKAVPTAAIASAAVTTHCDKSQLMRGTGSLSEAAALSAAGAGARLVAPRVISQDKMATCAIAEGGLS